jgi:uncharacterized protein (TIGR00297 family)
VSLLGAAAVSLVVTAAALALRALAASGVPAAWAVGASTLWTAGWSGGAILFAFFVPSSVISRLRVAPVSTLDAKGDRRDGWQVLANGGFPALGAACASTTEAAVVVLAAGLAAAAADTWATGVGIHSRSHPRHLVTGRIVPAGTSGGVTLLGTIGALGGASLVALTAWPLLGPRWFGGLIGIGMTGMVIDSVLGATIQGRFRCPGCDQPSEKRIHRCGARTEHVGGLRWISNDGVNALATGLATAAGWLAWHLSS